MLVCYAVFKGIITPLITPFKRSYEIDFNGVEWLIKHLIEGGVHGVFPVSTTGESAHLTFEEKKTIIRKVVDLVDGRVKVLPGVGTTSTLETIELGRFAKDVGVDGVVVITPYFFKLRPEDLKKHYSLIAGSLDLPIMIYHIPSITGANLPVKVVKELALEYSNIAGIKITYDSLTYIKNVIDELKEVRKDFSVFTGMDQHLLVALMMGGDGGVLALSNVFPKLHVSIYEAWLRRDFLKAYELYKDLLELSKAIEVGTSYPASIKACLRLAGAPIEDIVRPPLTEETKETIARIEPLIKKYLTYF
ncbi:MAG: 4-hydroxy-tetrahydrodipicolinate synthase [Zestosphaera tikiterensis]|uniref:4-hydroxy-tetrahydrodipicolinate synthase n=1 Tax=Zestosphaera tikiterensis TaxID=1973259 RepID=A0A2R7Y4Q2_9CREN|nr:MAG: 4-hydroxy-tetrahydrodipicolinate synthase [Zestosphaera tikiterensis]